MYNEFNIEIVQKLIILCFMFDIFVRLWLVTGKKARELLIFGNVCKHFGCFGWAPYLTISLLWWAYFTVHRHRHKYEDEVSDQDASFRKTLPPTQWSINSQRHRVTDTSKWSGDNNTQRYHTLANIIIIGFEIDKYLQCN